jgi:hypothetical protein
MLWYSTGTWRAIRQLNRPRPSLGPIGTMAALVAGLNAVLFRRHHLRVPRTSSLVVLAGVTATLKTRLQAQQSKHC